MLLKSHAFLLQLALLHLLHNRKCIMAIYWTNVKPMYLISMYPPPGSMQSTTDSDMDSYMHLQRQEPMIMNLETEPIEEDMLPNSYGPKAMDRIFGGNVAHPNCFPYQVGLLLQRPKGLYWCGGSLISDEYVLTAAHCVDMAKRALVFLGAHEIKNAKEVGQVRLMVTHNNFIIFPTWNPRRLKDDIALVRLPQSIDFTDKIQPIQLPKRSYEYRSFKDKLAIASGWGRYATGVHAISSMLRFVNLQIIDGKTCKGNFPLSYRATNICTSGKSAKSTCNGDSGGPLVVRRKSTKKRVLIGVTSFGSIFGCDRGYPAAFTKVASYLDWISDETGIGPYQDTSSNAQLFEKYIQEYQKKDKHPSDTETVADMAHMASIHESMQKYSDAELMQEETDKFKKSIGYNLYFSL